MAWITGVVAGFTLLAGSIFAGATHFFAHSATSSPVTPNDAQIATTTVSVTQNSLATKQNTASSQAASNIPPVYCNVASVLKLGDTDAATGGKVSFVQLYSGITPKTGVFDQHTQDVLHEKCKTYFDTSVVAPSGFLVPSSTTVPSGFELSDHKITSGSYSLSYKKGANLLSIEGFTAETSGMYSYDGELVASKKIGKQVQEFSYNNQPGFWVMDSRFYSLYYNDGARLVEVVGSNSTDSGLSGDALVAMLKSLVRQQ